MAQAALSVRIDTQSQAISVLSQAVSVLSQGLSVLSQSVSVTAAALSIRVDAQSQSISVLSQQVSMISQKVSVLSGLVSVFNVTGNILSAAVGATNIVLWRATLSCTVVNVHGLRVGGTSVVVNARKNGVSAHQTTDINLVSASEWTTGAAPINTAYVPGDRLEMMISVTGTPSQVAVQVDFSRP